jgi:hypothetical protein
VVVVRCLRVVLGGFFLLVPALLEAQLSTRGFAIENCDTNGDASRDLADGTHLLGYLFLGTEAPVPLADCGLEPAMLANGDSNGDGLLELSDAVHLLSWLFAGGEAPAGGCSGLEMGAGGVACRPFVAPPGSRAYGRSLAEWLEIYWRWNLETGADPDQSLVG